MPDIEDLYRRYADDVRRFALYLCGDAVMADEIMSDTFVRAWMATDRIRQPTVKSYLFAIVRNVHRDVHRRAARHTELDQNLPDGRITAEQQMVLSQDVRDVLAALQQLPEIDRAVLLMRALDGMSYEEIAESVGIQVVHARVKVHRARVTLMQARSAKRDLVAEAAGGARG